MKHYEQKKNSVKFSIIFRSSFHRFGSKLLLEDKYVSFTNS